MKGSNAIMENKKTIRSRERNTNPGDEQIRQGKQFAAWLKVALSRSGKDVLAIATEAGISRDYVYQLLRDGIKIVDDVPIYKRPSEAVITALAAATMANETEGKRAAGYEGEFPENWIPSPIADLPTNAQVALSEIVTMLRPVDVVFVPVLSDAAAAGATASVFADMQISDTRNWTGEKISIPRHLLRGAPDAEVYAVRVRGDSLIGLHIIPGDMIICRRANDAEDKDIVVAIVGDEVVTKRMRKRILPGAIQDKWLESVRMDGTTAEYPIAKCDRVTIVGVKVALYREG